MVLAGPALAGILDIDSVVVENRRFNDYPGSLLVPTDTYPTEVSWLESEFGVGGFANQHVARFSENDATSYVFLNSEGFDITVNAFLDVGSPAPRKETGFRMDTFVGGEGFFIITSDNEVAAFGGPFPFYSFGGDAYDLGTVVELRMIYTPDDDPDPFDGDAATMEYLYNGASSGPLNFGNIENGVINGSDFGVYCQNQPDDGNPGDFSFCQYTDFQVVPEPACLALVVMGAALVRGRRR
jgi:hypothetical protein